jgi:hypothetical protein
MLRHCFEEGPLFYMLLVDQFHHADSGLAGMQRHVVERTDLCGFCPESKTPSNPS